MKPIKYAIVIYHPIFQYQVFNDLASVLRIRLDLLDEKKKCDIFEQLPDGRWIKVKI